MLELRSKLRKQNICIETAAGNLEQTDLFSKAFPVSCCLITQSIKSAKHFGKQPTMRHCSAKPEKLLFSEQIII